MFLNITCPATDSVFSITVPEDLELENVKAFCEAEAGIPTAQIRLTFQGRTLDDDKKAIRDYGVQDGDMLVLAKKSAVPKPVAASGGLPGLDFSQIQVPGSSAGTQSGPRPSPPGAGNAEDPEVIYDMLKKSPETLGVLRHNNPTLAEAFDSGDIARFKRVLNEQHEIRAERERQRLRLLTADPFDMEAQRLIALEIENKNIEQNMELAMEHNPEAFGTVIMLYINCRVNGHAIKAFVDSGAQATIMSQSAAERCGIMRLVDKRWAGVAKGVGTQKIIGRVHLAQIQIEKDYLSTSFSILEEQPMDMLLGLDMLKRHQCCIDLNRNLLVIGSSGTETPFLSESELPECAKLSSKLIDMEKALQESSKEHEKKQLEEAMARSATDSKRLKSNDGTSTSTSTISGSSSSSSSAASGDSSDILASDKFTDEHVRKLMGYGFSRDKCIAELRGNQGDMEQATAALFAKSLKF
ncbi:protein DDI1 homolog 2-like isoform X2 [Tigriopus californicus]|uniref:protein DDI1 homolog 2-like isoform X2 n=1 Tax=Tigriopus californicus TaxID=6832 RepID=UPI0027DA79C6|nr:protein DDI1 homolog 2-like isoform X2 [Tigriopus californicus]